MKIVKHNKANIPSTILVNTVCDECRRQCKTENIYSLHFATNKNNGINIWICEDCAKELKMEIKLTIE